MGFDLHGIKPKINKELDDTTLYGMIELLPDGSKEDWAKRWDIMDNFTDEEREEYNQQMDDHHDKNPGLYFRNNVWWWRPLWTYVVVICEDILSDKDINSGSYNGGHILSANKCKKMATLLQKSIKDGTCKRYEFDITAHNKELKESDDEDVKFMSNYHFKVDNVKRFIKFLRQSGGCQIC